MQIYGFNPVPEDKQWFYLRDSIWPNIKNYTIKKRDAKNKTGAAGGVDVKYSKIDLKVLEILGVDSPVVEGLNIQEAGLSLISFSASLIAPVLSTISSSVSHGLRNTDRNMKKRYLFSRH